MPRLSLVGVSAKYSAFAKYQHPSRKERSFLSAASAGFSNFPLSLLFTAGSSFTATGLPKNGTASSSGSSFLTSGYSPKKGASTGGGVSFVAGGSDVTASYSTAKDGLQKNWKRSRPKTERSAEPACIEAISFRQRKLNGLARCRTIGERQDLLAGMDAVAVLLHAGCVQGFLLP